MLTLRGIVYVLTLYASVTDQKCAILKNLNLTTYTRARARNYRNDIRQIIVRDEISDLKDVHTIDVTSQAIPKLCTHGIANLPQLKSLNIRFCKIKTIEDDAFENLPKLTGLSIQDSGTATMIEKNAFRKVPSVKYLTLSSNKITRIEKGTFRNLPNLKLVDLSDNNIVKLDKNWFKNVPRLHKLFLAGNKIGEIPRSAFAGVCKNRTAAGALSILLWKNQIRYIHPEAFKGAKNVDLLYLGENRITDIDSEVFAHVKSIEYLSIDNNKMTCLTEFFLKNLHVREFSINNNTWRSDCLDKIRNWAQQRKVILRK